MPNLFEHHGVKPPERPAREPEPNSPMALLAAKAGVSPQELLARGAASLESSRTPTFDEVWCSARDAIRAQQRAKKSEGYQRGQDMARRVPSYSTAFDIRGRFGTPSMMQPREVVEGQQTAERGALPLPYAPRQGWSRIQRSPDRCQPPARRQRSTWRMVRSQVAAQS